MERPRKGKNNLLIPRDNETGPEKWCCYWYDPSALPSNVWLEVETMPIYGGVPLRLQYQVAPDGGDNIDVPSGEAADSTTVAAMYLTADELGRTLPDPCEETCGAFVHYNVDNDDGSLNSVEAPKRPGAGYANDTNPVTGENDPCSLSLTMSPLDLDEGVVVLGNNSSGELWTSDSKGSGNRVLASYTSLSWDLSDSQERSAFASFRNSSKYVEGASGTDDGEITLRYYAPGGSMVHRDRIDYTYIAADCGDQPTTAAEDIMVSLLVPGTSFWRFRTGYVQRQDIEGSYGDLVRCEYSITDNLAVRPFSGGHRCTIPEYNCIAWSVDETNVWYNPDYIAMNYGDKDGVFELADMDDFYYKKKGWTPITSGTDEERAEQAEAMYYSGFHAARKSSCGCGSGKWIMYESKTGQCERIEHVWDQLTGSYGTPIRFYE